MKTKTKTKSKPRQRRCQWMMEAKGWDECGKVATFVRPECQIALCDEHAEIVRLFLWAELQPLPANTKGKA